MQIKKCKSFVTNNTLREGLRHHPVAGFIYFLNWQNKLFSDITWNQRLSIRCGLCKKYIALHVIFINMRFCRFLAMHLLKKKIISLLWRLVIFAVRACFMIRE